MKKLFALCGSPHRNGVTEKLLRGFLSYADGVAVVERFNAYEQAIQPCDACGACQSRRGCTKTDGRDLFYSLEQSDYIVVATPVYLLSFPAPLKAVFDRFEQYYGARFGLNLKPPVERPKKAFVIITNGSDTYDGAGIILRQSQVAFSVMNTALAGSFTMSGTDTIDDNRLSQALTELGARAGEFFQTGQEEPWPKSI
ncbi:MAG: flavodoxin family protein [Clostridia bacterium]|nr:flavodoxin family protein [Clostridia bacterium]MDR3643971.1 flavodoxin family protein [Clostridia bacterium]